METTTLSRLNLDKLRQIIVLLTRLPEERVLDGSVYTDVSKWDDFITVTPLVSHSIGTEVKFEAENSREVVTTTRETTVSITAQGKQAFLLIEDLAAQMHTYLALQQLKAMGAGLVHGSEIQYFPEEEPEGKQQRAQLNLTLSHIHRIESSLTYGESVVITTLKEPLWVYLLKRSLMHKFYPKRQSCNVVI
nr:hypothetical protein [Providencia stuartii]